MKSKDSLLPNNIDHLVYTTPNLEAGMDKIEGLLGVRPERGGQHPDFATHNAILSLGPTTYLEVIAPDPSLKPPERGPLFQDYYGQEPRLTRWVIRTEKIEQLVEKAKAGGLDLGAIQSGNRKRPDGTVLSWKLTDPWIMPLDGAVPFLISWGDTPHPASSATRAGELIHFKIEHTREAEVRESLELIGTYAAIVRSTKFRLVAVIRTAKEVVEFY